MEKYLTAAIRVLPRSDLEEVVIDEGIPAEWLSKMKSMDMIERELFSLSK